MKRTYSKPTIRVEDVAMDMPVAANGQSYSDDRFELKSQGWFVNVSCDFIVGLDEEYPTFFDKNDTACYHSNIGLYSSS